MFVVALPFLWVSELVDIPERVGSGGGAALEGERQLVGPMSVAWSGPRLAFIAPYWAQWFQVVSGGPEMLHTLGFLPP
jgi:hypothetical protein